MTSEQFKHIVAKLDSLIRLAALNLVADKKQEEKIQLLNAAGFQPRDIAQIIGTTPNTVRVRLSNLRKSR